ncbi:MAG: hypothetical protein ACRDNZ_18960 [Streptosporangiaceae bacterium]
MEPSLDCPDRTASAVAVVPLYQTTAGTRGRYPGTCFCFTGINRAIAEIA